MTKRRQRGKGKSPPAPRPQTPVFKPSTYQPSRDELDEESEMPGMTDEEIRKTFFQPVGGRG